MKRYAVLLAVLLLCLCAAVCAQAEERTVASYMYTLAQDDGVYLENLIFNEDVIVEGDNAQIIFSNCEFNGDVILTADEGTKVLLLGCDVNGACVMRNQVREADVNYNNPKFLTDGPVNAVCEDCVGSVVAMGDFEFMLDGETYSMADAEFFYDESNPEAGFVPYDGQEGSYCIVAQWYENDEKNVMVVCDFDPQM